MRKRTIGILIMAFLLFAGAVTAYVTIGSYYKTHFFERTYINNFDVSDLTVAEAEKMIADQAEDYRITITEKGEQTEILEGSSFGYRFVSGGEVQRFMDKQNFLLWIAPHLGASKKYTMEASVTYDPSMLETAVGNLNCMDETQVTAPQDAFLTRQEDGTFVVQPEVEGNQLDSGSVVSLLKSTIESGGKEVNLVDSDCYNKPTVLSTDESLASEASIRNRYSSITVTYYMGGGVTEVLSSDTIYSWFSIGDGYTPIIDRDQVTAWVSQLADQYDTIGSFKPFYTSTGMTVYPESRTYGWMMAREDETEALYQLLLAGESAEREPIWYETAFARGENDLGSTYVEIDYTNQRMWYYKDGVLLVETPVVTGNVSAGNASPEGVFSLAGKEEHAVLVGEDYKTPVDYWMPFCDGVGIHDADSWRTAYGGDIYMTSGSHGCINTPTAQAAIIYQNIDVGTPVVCYSSGVYIGYEIVGSSSTETEKTGDSDIVIVDETEEEWADESLYYGPDGSWNGGDDWTDDSGWSDDNWDEFPVTIEDSWSEQSGQDIVIY